MIQQLFPARHFTADRVVEVAVEFTRKPAKKLVIDLVNKPILRFVVRVGEWSICHLNACLKTRWYQPDALSFVIDNLSPSVNTQGADWTLCQRPEVAPCRVC